MDQDPKLLACAEIAYEADRKIRHAKGKDPRNTPGWFMLDDEDRARWVAWVHQVLHGSATLTPGQHFAASVARSAAEYLGLDISADGQFGRIVTVVAAHLGTSPEDIVSDSRMSEAVWARHVIMFFATEARYSISAIGRYLGRDHTAVRHGLRRVRREIATGDAAVLSTIAALRAELFPVDVPHAA